MMLIFLTIHFALLLAAIAAAAFGLWGVAIIDLLAYFGVFAGLRVLRPAKRATLTYEEIVGRNLETLPLPAKDRALKAVAA